MKALHILPPIIVIESDNYMLVLKDANEVYHYFTDDGNYDGYSKDLIIRIDDSPELKN